MTKFYDTCSLLSLQEKAFENFFYISSITLDEIENIKTSANKDNEIKFKARKILRLLHKNLDKYWAIPFKDIFLENPQLNGYSITNDLKIVSSALYLRSVEHKNFTFSTEDLSCYTIAKTTTLDVEITLEDKEKSEYQGFKEVIYNDNDLAFFYNSTLNQNNNTENLLENEYLIIKNSLEQIVDKYKWTKEGYKKVPFLNLKSKMFGSISPYKGDHYQNLAIDSLYNNQITVLRGDAGSGKSMLGLAFLFQELEKGRIERIVMFVNPVATKDSCKFGFLPGTFLDKVLGSQIGNFLASKLGGIEVVYQLIEKGMLEFIALADARGYDTTGMNCGVYVTEAQNTNREMMKLILSRIGEDTLCVIEGDNAMQTDMLSYEGENNGLKRLCEVYKGEPYFGTVTLQNCYRSRIAEKALEL